MFGGNELSVIDNYPYTSLCEIRIRGLAFGK